jgi:predicted O-methyltransferase YrrM
VARSNLAAAGFHEPQVKILLGPAVDTLKTLDAAQPFDFVFIDADKPSNMAYMREAKRLTRSGGVIASLAHF